MRTLLHALLLAALFVSLRQPTFADNREIENTSVAAFARTTIAASGTATAIIHVGKSTYQAAGYAFTTTGTLAVNVVVTYSDTELASGSSLWETAASVEGSDLTTGWSIAASPRRTNLLLPGSNYIKIVLTNADTVPVQLDRFTLFKQ